MVDSQIDNLPAQNYSERVIRSKVGETSALRLIDPNDKKDMERVREINGTLPKYFLQAEKTDDWILNNIKESVPGSTNPTDEAFFGVAGTEKVGEKEKGELQGWISMYADEHLPELIKKGLLKENEPSDLVIEMAYARHPDAPPGQIASALRQVCNRLSEIEAIQNPETTEPHGVVTAYTKKGNENTLHVLEASGFEKRTEDVVFEDGKGSWDLYVLNWKKLNEISHEKADAAKPRVFEIEVKEDKK